MASKPKTVSGTESEQSVTAVEKAERKRSAADEQEIRARAYEIYLQRGEEPGDEVGDWLQAERELSANPSKKT
jgi:hypothetical protein